MIHKTFKYFLPFFLILSLVMLSGCADIADSIKDDILQQIFNKLNPFDQAQYTPDSFMVKITRFINDPVQSVKEAVQPGQSSWGMIRSAAVGSEIKRFGTDLWIPVRYGMLINSGDAVRTISNMKDGNWTEISGPGGRIVRLYSDTIFRAPIYEPTIDRDNLLTEENASKTLEIIKGRLWLYLDEVQHPAYYMTTPNAIAGVKGTEFEVIVDNNGNTTFNVIAGVVEVSDLNVTKTVTLNAGQTSSVPPKGTPSVPKTFDPNSLNPWWEEPYKLSAEEIAQVNRVKMFGWIIAFVVIILGISLIVRRRRKNKS